MKLRIRGNSLRLRLTQGEVESLKKDGRVEDGIAFGAGPEQRLAYALESSSESHGVAARYADGRITVLAPTAVVAAWAATDQVGFAGEVALDGGETLHLLIEKDFACLTRREGEDESDAYPHPLAGARR